MSREGDDVRAGSGQVLKGAAGVARLMALAALLAAPPARASTPEQTSQPPAPQGTAQGSASKKAPDPAKPSGPPSHYLPNRFAGKAGHYYKLVWGIDSLSVKLVESGELVRFAWRVLDPEKARLLNDKKLEPSLVDPQAGVSLVVPVMDKIGQLRQGVEPEAGRSYWMVFSNKGRLIKRGARVSVQVGEFRADGLVVD
jgi:hypothetical protein